MQMVTTRKRSETVWPQSLDAGKCYSRPPEASRAEYSLWISSIFALQPRQKSFFRSGLWRFSFKNLVYFVRGTRQNCIREILFRIGARRKITLHKCLRRRYIYMERDDTRCYINLRKRRRERSVSSISRLIRNFGLHFSTLVSMSRRLRKTRGNVVRVMQRKWIYISTFERKLENPSSRIERFFPISSVERARIYMHIKVVGLFRNLWNRMIWGDAEKSLRSFWSHVHTLPSSLSSARARRQRLERKLRMQAGVR